MGSVPRPERESCEYVCHPYSDATVAMNAIPIAVAGSLANRCSRRVRSYTL